MERYLRNITDKYLQGSIEIPKQTLQVLLLESFRYCIGRMTYAVSDCVENLTWYWEELPKSYQKMIKREIEEAIKNNCAGHPCDIVQWMRILKLETKE